MRFAIAMRGIGAEAGIAIALIIIMGIAILGGGGPLKALRACAASILSRRSFPAVSRAEPAIAFRNNDDSSSGDAGDASVWSRRVPETLSTEDGTRPHSSASSAAFSVDSI